MASNGSYKHQKVRPDLQNGTPAPQSEESLILKVAQAPAGLVLVRRFFEDAARVIVGVDQAAAA